MPETVSLTGNVGREVKTDVTPNGKLKTEFSLALYGGKDKNGQNLTTWVKVTTWGDEAEVARKKVQSGARLRVTGILHSPTVYEAKDGSNKASLELTAFHIYKIVHDIRYDEQTEDVVA